MISSIICYIHRDPEKIKHVIELAEYDKYKKEIILTYMDYLTFDGDRLVCLYPGIPEIPFYKITTKIQCKMSEENRKKLRKDFHIYWRYEKV